MGDNHYYKVNVPAGEDLLITLDSASETGFNEMYVRYGSMPDRGQYDYLVPHKNLCMGLT